MTIASIDPGKGGRVVGRYVLFDELASGGMATVYLGRLVGAAGFSRTVAIKRLHPHFAKDPDFRAMILDEARIVSRIQHTNVIPTIDVVEEGEDMLLVMEYVHGEPVSRLLRAARLAGKRLPSYAVATIIAQALYGLHAAHEARDDRGQPLHVVHRDVSPQNIMVGVDGVTRVLDFGVAKAAGRIQSTRDGSLKGKLQYMPPEQIRGEGVDRRTDVYAASVVLWEMLVGRMLFRGENEAATLHAILESAIPAPSSLAPMIGHELDAIVMRGLSRNAADRYPTALDMAEALYRIGMATAGEISGLVRQLGADTLETRGRRVAEIESKTIVGLAAPPVVAPPAPVDSAPPLPLPVDASPNLRAPLRSTIVATKVRPKVEPEIKSQTRLLVMTAAGVFLLGGTLAMGWYLGNRSNDEMVRPVGTIPSSFQSNSVPVASIAPPMATSAVPLANVSASAPSAIAPSQASSAATTKLNPRSPGVKGRNCNPPYTVDEDGIRTPKPECL